MDYIKHKHLPDKMEGRKDTEMTCRREAIQELLIYLLRTARGLFGQIECDAQGKWVTVVRETHRQHSHEL